MTSITNRFCSICLDTKPTNVFNCLPCLHWFCQTCLAKLVQNVCPLCRFPFETDLSVSSPINTTFLSRSAPTGREAIERLAIVQDPELSRSVDSTSRDLEMIVNFTGIQNIDSLSQVLTDLEVRERTQYRRRRRRGRQRRPPPPPPSPSTPPSPLLSGIFQFDENSDVVTTNGVSDVVTTNGVSDDDSKTEDALGEANSSEPKQRRTGRGDRWAYLNRQRGHRSGR